MNKIDYLVNKMQNGGIYDNLDRFDSKRKVKTYKNSDDFNRTAFRNAKAAAQDNPAFENMNRRQRKAWAADMAAGLLSNVDGGVETRQLDMKPIIVSRLESNLQPNNNITLTATNPRTALDNLSFSEAFATARRARLQNNGPETFMWRGNLYGTELANPSNSNDSTSSNNTTRTAAVAPGSSTTNSANNIANHDNSTVASGDTIQTQNTDSSSSASNGFPSINSNNNSGKILPGRTWLERFLRIDARNNKRGGQPREIWRVSIAAPYRTFFRSKY